MARPRSSPRPRGIQSVEIGGRLLSALSRSARALGLGELAYASAMSPSKAHRYLASFARIGLVEQDATSGMYDLGAFALRLGFAAQSRIDVVRRVRSSVLELRRQLNETVGGAVWVDGRPTVIHLEECDRSILRVVALVGAPLPLFTSAGGLLFAAYLPKTTVEPLVDQELKENARLPREAAVPRTKRQANLVLAGVRKRGLARAYPLFSTAVCTLGAPVFGAGGTITAVLVALGYRSAFDARYDGQVAESLRQAARRLSERLGYLEDGTRQPAQRRE